MSINISRTFFHLAVSLVLVFVFTGGDCLTDDNPYSKIEPPGSAKLILNENSAGEAEVIVHWSRSADQNDADFNGYRVGTYELNSANQVVALHKANITAADTFMLVSPIERGKRYISYVTTLSKEKRNSDSVATKIYSGVYANRSNAITNQVSSNAFGWNVANGSDSTYALNNPNSQYIDLICLVQGSNLNFISPNQFPPGSKVTRMELMGKGVAAYNETELSDPILLTPLLVEEDNVYLLKIERLETQSHFYIKLWVRDISISSGLPAVVTVTFDYKLQSIAGLLVL